VAGSDLSLVEGAIKRSDVVFYLTDLVTHAHFKIAVKASEKYSVPFHFVNGKGINTFKDQLNRWVAHEVSNHNKGLIRSTIG
nr:hypothetical protein [Anaerobacillus isosaccharinicus]